MSIRMLAAFAAGVMVAAAGTAFATTKVASIIGPDNQVHACYLTSAGLLRVVAAGEACRNGETAIAWSATGSGAQGPAGPAGAVGPTGPAGPKGDAGATWRGVWSASGTYKAGDLVRHNGSVWIHRTGLVACLVGQNCVTPGQSPFWQRFAQDGAAGPQGVAGVAGPAGPRGLEGPRGVQGPIGPSGPAALTISTVGSTINVPGYSVRGGSAHCPSGYKMTGGGVTGDMTVRESVPAGNVGWQARVHNGTGLTQTAQVVVVCIK